jgi:hypothetical protein
MTQAARTEVLRNSLVGMPERKRQFGRSMQRWEEHIRLHLTEIKREQVDWICRFV